MDMNIAYFRFPRAGIFNVYDVIQLSNCCIQPYDVIKIQNGGASEI